MNAAYIKKSVAVAIALIALILGSCSNPAGPRLSQETYEEPSTGIDTDESSGLVAGLPLEGDALLSNPAVTVADSVTWEAGLSGDAMRGDEDGDFFRITDGTLPETLVSGSVEVWIYPESPAGENNKWAGILHKGQETDFSDEAWSLQYQGKERAMFNYHYELNGANKYKSVTASQTLSEGEWHHVAVTWICDEISGDVTLELYLDGVLDKSASFPGIGPMMESDGDLIVGSQLPEQYSSGWGHLTFMGLIDEVTVYDHVRTAEEILADYQVYFPGS